MLVTGSVDDKLAELQEAIQKLQMLKQLGAENLVIEQEKAIFSIQKEIMELNRDTSMDPVDYLPKKCRYCDLCKTDEERLDCSEKNLRTCKQREPPNMSLLTMGFLKVLLLYGVVLLLLLTFSLLADVFIKFIEDKVIVFVITSLVLVGIILLFRSPFMNLYRLLS